MVGWPWNSLRRLVCDYLKAYARCPDFGFYGYGSSAGPVRVFLAWRVDSTVAVF